MRTIRFARLSFERKLSHYADERDAIERRKSVLRDVIHYDTDVNFLLKGTDLSDKTQKGQWKFGDIEDGDNFIAGRIGKEREETNRRPDDDVKGFVEYEGKDTDVSFFVIDLTSSVMAYEFRRDVGEKAPFRILQEAFNAYHGGKENISISPMADKEEVRDALDHLAKITRVRFANLTPTNPDSTDRSRPMDVFLRESNMDRLLFDGRNESDEDDDKGIDLEGEPLLDGGLNLAEEGYGSATVEGEDEDGEEVQVSTNDQPIESEVEPPDNDEAYRQTLVTEIRKALDGLED